MDESVFYIAEGDPTDKNSQESFASSTSIHTSQQHASFRQADCPKNGAVLTGFGQGERLFVSSISKAIINVYSWGKDGVDQRIPIPEALTCLTIINQPTTFQFHQQFQQYHQHQQSNSKLPSFKIPWLLAGGSKSGKLYIWELSSGNLLCVKDAHYQTITSIKFSKCGTYLITASEDSRCMIWRTLDLISIYYNDVDHMRSIKPYYAISDNTLAINDIEITSNGLSNDLKLYTVSKDTTLRIYDITSKQLLTTFILPYSIETLVLDPANRAVYVGLSNGLIRSVPLYNLNPKTSILESVGGNSKIITVDNDPNFKTSFIHHQQRTSSLNQNKSILHKSNHEDDANKPIYITKLSISLDGTNIISGDSLGRVFASDIVTKQVIKSFTPCNSPISYIHVNSSPLGLVSDSNKLVDKRHRLLPQLKRILASNEQVDHQLLMEIPAEVDDDDEDDDEDFEQWLSTKVSQELEFRNLSTINSTVKTIASKNTNTNVHASANEELQDKLSKVSNAYNELRKKHEDLIKEHSKVLNNL
ncbi:Pre-rRNA-processing protein IPI3 [Scheffersomyces coipomensis]|uniref:Pre-rRNA-processing protein IPI3 n=1 Tax=Scheffersomyces coipomensis TaxID=1788519 RepID=UPI00315DB700